MKTGLDSCVSCPKLQQKRAGGAKDGEPQCRRDSSNYRHERNSGLRLQHRSCSFLADLYFSCFCLDFLGHSLYFQNRRVPQYCLVYDYVSFPKNKKQKGEISYHQKNSTHQSSPMDLIILIMEKRVSLSNVFTGNLYVGSNTHFYRTIYL